MWLAFAAGVAIGSAGTLVLVSLALRGIHRQQPKSAHAGAQARCTACGAVFDSTPRATEHLREVHNAPGSDREIASLVDRVEVGG